ncbi:hypothetical protein BJV78DRAFT_1285605 [Lactifluus subvellereus]|nr:hypothetical protein BJV78DRAFT_1285605 [Lactifluus subvellereus]
MSVIMAGITVYSASFFHFGGNLCERARSPEFRHWRPNILVHTLDDYMLLNIFFGYGTERWWYKLAQVCRKWRYLILASPSRLGLRLVCTHGTPVADMLAHSPPLPLIIDHLHEDGETSGEDEDGIRLPLQQRDHAGLPIRSLLLITTTGLVTLLLANIPESTYFPPDCLLAWLSLMPNLEVLAIGFRSPTPSRDFKELAYLERLVAQINAPRLKKLQIQFFNQLTFTIPRLVQFISVTENFMFNVVGLIFSENGVIFRTLLPLLSVVKNLSLAYAGDSLSMKRHNDVNRTQWRELLRPFSNVKALHIENELVGQLFHSLQSDDGETPLEPLPNLKELILEEAMLRMCSRH